MSMIPAFSVNAVTRSLLDFADKVEQDQIMTLAYIGEEYVNRAKSKRPGEGSFTDRTGNLRSSIGYVVAFDGDIVRQSTPGDEPEGKARGDMIGELLADQYHDGLVLIVYAGMEYAAAVESKGFDVITGSAPLASELRSFLGDIGMSDAFGGLV